MCNDDISVGVLLLPFPLSLMQMNVKTIGRNHIWCNTLQQLLLQCCIIGTVFQLHIALTDLTLPCPLEAKSDLSNFNVFSLMVL